MTGLTLSPSLGWIAGSILAASLVIAAIACIVLHIRRRSNTDETAWACARRVVLCLVLAVMALTPSIVSTTTSTAVNNTDVLLAVDVTGSMAVTDAHYGSTQSISRLDAAKKAIGDITDSYANSSFVGLHFGSGAAVDVPLTPDTLAVNDWANKLTVEATSLSAGSSLDTPLNQLLVTLKSIRDSHPNDRIVLYMITDGEQTSQKTRRTYSSLRQYLDDAFTIGVGSTSGGNIPLVKSDVGTTDTTNQWVTDPSTGKPGVSRMDRKNLTDMADEMGGTCIITGTGKTLQGQISSKASKQWSISQTVRRRERVSPVVWPFAMAAMLLLALELGSWASYTRRSL